MAGRLDAAAVSLALCSVSVAFLGGGTARLQPSWRFAVDAHDAPPPVVLDVGGDGSPDVLIASHDGHLLLLSSLHESASHSNSWLPLEVLRKVSLRSHLGLATGSFPVAVAAGSLDPPREGERRRDVVVALTEDWTVSAFDDQLHLLWRHSIGRPSMARARGGGELSFPSLHEVSLLVSDHSIYTGDRGAVLIAGRTEPKASLRPVAPAAGAANESSEASAHPLQLEYFALEGGSGAHRWEHRAADLLDAVDEENLLYPQAEYRLDVRRVGRHAVMSEVHAPDAELHWRLFSDSLMAQLPHVWRHPRDTTLQLAHFSRSRRAAAPRGSRHAALGASGFTRLRRGAAAVSRGAAEESRAPNVVVARRQHGVEVHHLYTGRTLTQLPLEEAQAHADLNGDGKIDHVAALSSDESAELAASRRKSGGAECLALARTGVPVREQLWNASICRAERKRGKLATRTAAAPLLLRSAASGGRATMDSVLLVSTGQLTSVGADGKQKWNVMTEASWRPSSAEGDDAAAFPSLSLLSREGEDALILAVGERHACLVTAEGAQLGCVKLPSSPVAPPTLADFDGDGIVDVILSTRSSLLGIRVLTSAGSVLKKLLFGFMALAAIVIATLRYNGITPKVALD